MVSAISRSASAFFETSACTTTASPPALRISSATAAALSMVETQLTATLAPSRAKRFATALPMPRELPVTIAVLPLRSMACLPVAFGVEAKGRGGQAQPAVPRFRRNAARLAAAIAADPRRGWRQGKWEVRTVVLQRRTSNEGSVGSDHGDGRNDRRY